MRFSAEQLRQGRARAWARLQPALARTPALAAYHGRPLAEYPSTDPGTVRSDYGAWNSLDMTDDALRTLGDAAENGTARGDLSAGWSTGSSGAARGLFVANERERADYIGQSLARLLPARALLERQRLALHLRASNALYSDVKTGRFTFAHFPLERSAQETVDALSQFDPTILIAPPHRLIAFAKAGLRLPSLRHLFCGSEPIGPAESKFVADAFSLRPRAIFQATEGFLGAECEHGQLHLNEHSIEFELEPVPGTDGFRLIVTDLRRVSQPIVRLRGDDYIEINQRRCPCGYAGRVIHPPQGRVSDIWRFTDRIITPVQVVECVEAHLVAPSHWQAIASPVSVQMRTGPEVLQAHAKRAANALGELTGQQVNLEKDLSPWSQPKRRRVVWAG